MSKIEDREISYQYRDQVNRLRKDYEKNIEKLSETQQKQVVQLEEHNQNSLDSLRDEHNKKILEEIARKDLVLSQLKKDLLNTQTQLNSQYENLTQSNISRIDHQNTSFENKMADLIAQHEEQLKTIDRKYSDAISNSKKNGDGELSVVNEKYRSEVSRTQASHKKEINQLRKQYANLSRDEEIKHSTDFEKKRVENNRAMLDLQRKHYEKMQLEIEKAKIENDQTKEQLKKDLQLDKESFESRYTQVKKEQDQVISQLQQRTNTIVQSMKNEFSTQADLVSNKASNPFYKIQTIEPKIMEDKDQVIISLQVAPHEVSNVRLQGKDRDVKLTFDRKFEDRVENESGKMINSRAESMVREFKVNDILDHKKLSKTYLNGEVVFKIAKK
jgi:hypothetical protein